MIQPWKDLRENNLPIFYFETRLAYVVLHWKSIIGLIGAPGATWSLPRALVA